MYNLTNTQQANVPLKISNSRGGPASVDGTPEWANSDDTLATLEVAADGMSAVLKAVGPIGVGRVTVTADADLGAGTSPIVGVLDFEVLAGAAVVIELVPDAPTEQG